AYRTSPLPCVPATARYLALRLRPRTVPAHLGRGRHRGGGDRAGGSRPGTRITGPVRCRDGRRIAVALHPWLPHRHPGAARAPVDMAVDRPGNHIRGAGTGLVARRRADRDKLADAGAPTRRVRRRSPPFGPRTPP